MPYQLWVKDEAKAEIKRLPGYMRQRIQETVKQLSNQPRPHNSIQMDSPLEGRIEVRRLRIDTWRVI